MSRSLRGQYSAPTPYRSYYIPSGRCIQAIDYTDHGADRKATRNVDSLRKEFYTAAGRMVYDGGGVTPDVEIEREYVSRFAATLYGKGLIEEWGEGYFRESYKDDIDLDTFDVTDADFAEFKELVSGRKVDYKSQTSRAITALEKAAEEDRNEELMEDLKRIKEGLKDDMESNLERYKEEIMNYMRRDVILRRGYAAGVIRNSLGYDEEVKRAVELLMAPDEMAQILSGAEPSEGD